MKLKQNVFKTEQRILPKDSIDCELLFILFGKSRGDSKHL